ncbi:RHS repeat-associated core domain-containing protein [Streptomyces sp. Isolate_219]|uniref:RHS repeat-associated core domain-containing protein n=1 Tax=Streptomyces sp. Isolate_219 TaxID=2950110 RepID=UPI0021C7144A|nr:RHS repeat-associated core domain-containing protein [Streptomyces sp. Isolate_219]MCR8575919.1 RHS repeat-associated core domain-containing protein [Streptomyces sp. Isolate_219]
MYTTDLPRSTPPRGRRWTQRIAVTLSFTLLPGLISPVAFAADPDPLGRPSLTAPRAADVKRLTVKADPRTAAQLRKAAAADTADRQRARTDQQRTTTWPTTGTARLTTTVAHAKAKPGDLPITLTKPPGRTTRSANTIEVGVLGQDTSHALGLKGVVLTATGPARGGSTQIDINYAAFASAYGGDYAGRLRLMSLPTCALTTPDKAACRHLSPQRFTNQRARQQITAPLTFKAGTGGQKMVLALAAGTKSGAGDYKATPLAASSTWEAGGSSGSFTWSYPLRTPPAAAGPTPDLNISYDSGSVDGRTASTNNQGTTIGEGFDLTSSYIERKYGSCDDDGQDDKFDQCWKYDNASLVLNGKATELVKDDTTGHWHLKNDDASLVTHHTGADNSDDNGEYWTVTTADGTTYTFGLNKLPGAGADDRTDSVWTAPVFGDDKDEPGYDNGTTFAKRDKKQAWRWNLDLVQDTHANAMTYWYQAETNNYDKLGDDNTGTPYTRGGYLKEIRYGQRAGSLFSATPAASNKVVLNYTERCTATGDGCDSLTKDTRDNWPDVPFDAVCKDDDKCTGNVAPTFFTRKRLTSLTTYAWDTTTATPAYAPIDAWNLKQQYLDPGDTGDSSDQSLWLDEIKHTGKRGTDIALPPVRLDHEFKPNRVDGASDNILSLEKPRLKTVTSEAGAQTIVSYAEADCVAGQTMPKVDHNTRRCYPVYWKPNGGSADPQLDWFQKYPVTSVSTTDPHGGSVAVQHTYTYSGGGAWHYNDDPLTPAKERTWSLWRGYEKVTHLTGDPSGTQSKTTTVYMRGMNGDRLLAADGKTLDPDKRRTATVTGIKATDITDSEQYTGFTRETATYNNAAYTSGTVNDPWSKRTATQHKSYADTEAYFTRTGATHARTAITSGITPTDRIRTTITTHDDLGMQQTVEDRGDDAENGDETCTRTWYARNDDGLTSLVSRTRTTSKPCTTSDTDLDLPADSSRPGDVISDTATAYDTTTWSANQKPTKGDAQWTGRAKGYDTANSPTWQKTATTDHDALGRPTLVKDARDHTKTTTTYTPATSGPLLSKVSGDAKGYETTTTLDPATGSPLKATDPNGRITETEYDSLGRVTKVWLPNRSHLAQKTPNYVYGYHLASNDLPWVSTGTLRGDGNGYNTTYEIYDSLLRIRQVQTPSPTGGRLIALTLYDSRGFASSAQSDIWDEKNDPSGTAVQTEGSQAPTQTDTTYDGAERPIKAVTRNYGTARWTTQTTYTGDTTSTTAPIGGQAVATVTDARGQTTQRLDYDGPTPTGTDYVGTNYTYTLGGQPRTVTGPVAGTDTTKPTWSHTYDLFGRQTATADPDKGTTSTAYDDLDQVTTVTDAENRTLVHAYDELGRKTGTWQGSKTDANKLTAWTFDALAKGQPDASIRYEGGAGGKAYIQKVTRYDSLYQATESQLSLPESDPLVKAGVPKTLSTTTGYRLDGTISQASQPAVASLPAETVSYTYNATGKQLTAKGTTGYLQGADYAPAGDLRRLTLGTNAGTSAKNAYLGYDYEPGTRRLTRSYVTDDTHPYRLQDLVFRQDDAGNVTSISDATTLGGTGKSDNQCFAYDGYRRLSEAWTPKTDDCSANGRTSTNLTGAAPYWTSYTYNSAGQRKQQVQHATSGDTITTYNYGTPNKQPHPLTSTETNGKTQTYTYDKTGNTIQRPGSKANQALHWNSEGKLSSATEPDNTGTPSTTGYLYDANGDLLIRRAATDGMTTLYFGDTEIRLTTKGALSGLRYYTAAGKSIAVRTATGGASTKLTFLAADHHGTSSLAIDAGTFNYAKRYTTPFGAPRGTAPTAWPDDKSFLGAPADTGTGLTHIGAREYDPLTGAFLSVDPLLETDKPQTLNGYSYSSNNPTTNSDPTGLGNADCMTGVMEHCNNGVPGTGSVYHPERERHSGCSVGCYSGGSSGTAYTSSGGSVNSGHWGSTCNRFSCNKRWLSGPRGDDKDWLGGILTGIVDTATVGCQVFKIFGSVNCAGDAIREEMAGSGVGLETSAFSDGIRLGATFAPVPGAGFFKTGDLAVGGMLARRGKNIGPFQELPIPMQKRTVKKVAQRAGVGLDGVKVKINRDADLVGRMLYGHTAPNRTITLYPDAFSSAENLTKTIGHERQHVMQIDTYGPATSLEQEHAWERAAYASEGQFWNYYNGRLG